MPLQTLKQIFRSLWRYKNFSLINLLGLSIGIAAVVILLLLTHYENSFDSFHSGTSNVYRVVSKRERDNQMAYQATVPYSLAALLRAEMRQLPATEIHYVNEMNIRI